MQAIFLFLVLGTGMATATEPSPACSFTNENFTDINADAFAQRVVAGHGDEMSIRLFRTLPNAVKQRVLERSFRLDIEALESRLTDAPFNPKFPLDAFGKLATRDAFAREQLALLSKNLTVKPATKQYVEEEWAYLLSHSVKPLQPEQIEAISQQKPTTVSAWLALLPSVFRGQYTTMFDSQDLQSASKEFPKILFFDDETVITANGDASQRLFGTAQILKMHPDKATSTLSYIQELPNGAVRTSEVNPVSCQQCHGAIDSHALFPNFSFWPGAVGSDHDRVIPESPEAVALENMRRLVKNKHARYGLLEHFEEYAEREAATVAGEDNTSAHTLIGEPNSRLNIALNLHAMTRMLRLLTTSKDYCRYRYAIFASLLGCEATEEFVPVEVRSRMKPLAYYVKDTTRLSTLLAEEFTKAHPKSTAHDRYDSERIASLRFLLEGRGISMQGWSIDPITGYGWSDGLYNLDYFTSLVAYADQALTPFSLREKPKEERCQLLKEASFAALGKTVHKKARSKGKRRTAHGVARPRWKPH